MPWTFLCVCSVMFHRQCRPNTFEKSSETPFASTVKCLSASGGDEGLQDFACPFSQTRLFTQLFSTHSSSRIKLFFNGNVRPDSLQTVPSALKAGRRTHFWACTRTFRAHHSVWSYSPCPSAPLRAALRRAAPRCCHFTTTFHSASDKSSAPLQLHLIHNSLSQFPQSVPEAT